MAPFPIIESQPQIAPRRAEPDQITLSVTHASTTYATVILLGSATVIETDGAATTYPTTTVASAPTQSAQVTLPRDTSSGSSNSGVVVGAVLGSVLGTLVILTVLYKCFFDNRSAIWIPTTRNYDSDLDSGRSSSSSRVHRRGGGREGFGRDNRHGDRVRKPRRARTRRTHRDESISRSEPSYRNRYSNRRSGLSNSDGLLGWFLLPRTTPNGYRYSEKRNTRTSWAGVRAMNTADD